MRKKSAPVLSHLSEKKILERLEDYLESCRPPPPSDGKKTTARLPNLAGFCRFLECGILEFDLLRGRSPALYGRISAILEDELLNFSPSPALLSTYLKKRLGYADAETNEHTEDACGQVRLIFEHDIVEDGA